MRIHKLALIAATAGLAASVPLGRPPAPAPAFHPSALLRDGGLTVRDLPASSVSWRGGPVVAATGESVKLFVSNAYTPDVNDVQPWADFVAGLIHGPELALLTAYIATPAEVETLCDGVNVLGCYGDDTLVAIGEPVDGVQPQEVVRHEYGHHVAANRLNPPWLAVDWGTKRWATQQSVCTRSNAGSAYPGDEGLKYTLNPGEAFAEAYRVLNDTRAGAALDWPLVDPSFLPDAVALQAVADDVSVPWAGPTASVVHGRFTPSGRRTWTTPLPTPLDGSLTVDLTFPPGTHYAVVLTDGAGTRVLARGFPSGAVTERLTYLVCGGRTGLLRVTRHGRPGRFALHITRP
jgi:hypothetical protein